MENSKNQIQGQTLSIGSIAKQNAVSREAFLTKIEAMKGKDWTSGPLPLTRIEACAVLAEITTTIDEKPTPRISARFVQELVACFPNFKPKAEDSRIITGKLSQIFEAYSIDAAHAVLNPVTGLVGKAQFLNLADLNAELYQHQDKILWVQLITKRIISEHDKRDAEAVEHQKRLAEEEQFKAANGGKSSTQVWIESQSPSRSLKNFVAKPLTAAGIAFANNPTEETLNALKTKTEKQRGLN